MKKVLYFVLLIVFMASCSVQSKLSRSFKGEGREKLIMEFGSPDSIIKRDDESEIYVYVTETRIRATEINTGSFTLDKRMSPSMIKVERKLFYISEDGIILACQYEKEYE